MLLHASVRINVQFLIRSRFSLIPLRILVQIHYSSDSQELQLESHTQTLGVNSCLHVYLHIVMRIPGSPGQRAHE